MLIWDDMTLTAMMIIRPESVQILMIIIWHVDTYSNSQSINNLCNASLFVIKILMNEPHLDTTTIRSIISAELKLSIIATFHVNSLHLIFQMLTVPNISLFKKNPQSYHQFLSHILTNRIWSKKTYSKVAKESWKKYLSTLVVDTVYADDLAPQDLRVTRVPRCWVISRHSEYKMQFLHSYRTRTSRVNSLAPGRFQFDFRYVIFKLTLVNGGWGISLRNCPQMNATRSYWW